MAMEIKVNLNLMSLLNFVNQLFNSHNLRIQVPIPAFELPVKIFT